MPNIANGLRILKSQGAATFLHGLKRRRYYQQLQSEYGFDNWHIQPYELRPYAWDIVGCVNESKLKNSSVCEIGCGLGDLIRNLDMQEKNAFDLSPEVISCAKMLDKRHKGAKTEYHVGSFQEASEHLQKASLLITVNFIHGIPPEELRQCYKTLLQRVDVGNIIADTVEGYRYCHDFQQLLPEWKVEKVIGTYEARKVLWLSRKD